MEDTTPLPSTLVVHGEVAPAFQFEQVPKAHREWLCGATQRIRAIARKNVADLVEVGTLIAEARTRLKKRTLDKWLRSGELPWSRAHSYRLISVAEAFAPFVTPATTAQFDATALYALSRPEVKPEARQCALQLAATRPVTAADARQILGKPERRQTPRGELQREKETKGQRDEEPPGPMSDTWRLFVELVDRCDSLHVTVVRDSDDVDFSVTVYRPDERPRNALGATLEEAVKQLIEPESE
jgi:hypothetical protein